eukprot:2660179-Prymnesium_polylepis.1
MRRGSPAEARAARPRHTATRRPSRPVSSVAPVVSTSDADIGAPRLETRRRARRPRVAARAARPPARSARVRATAARRAA